MRFRRRTTPAAADTDVRAIAGPVASACFAPHSALYLRPDGVVHACCTTGFSVGSVTGPERQSLLDIWNGAALQEQRSALEAGVFDAGCQECERVASTGGRGASLAANFDRFADGAPHPYPKLLDLALSNRCNLQCVMCNGELSSTIRANREGRPPLPPAYDDRFFDELDEFLPHAEHLQFKGGEPFLAPENRRIWDRLIELGLHPEVTVTTNGTVLNEQVERYVTELRMHPIVSVDAMSAPVLESIRVGVDGLRLWSNIDRFQALAETAGNGMTLSFCLVRSNCSEVIPFLAEVDRRGLECSVIVVYQPAEHDLLRLGEEELRVVLTELEDHREFQHESPRRALDEVLRRIRSHLDPTAEVVEPSVGVPARGLDRGTQDLIVAELEDRYGQSPLVVEALGGRVHRVESPEWSRWLRADALVGHDVGDLRPVIETTVGPTDATVIRSPFERVSALRVSVHASDGLRHLVVHRLVDASSGDERVLVVEDPGRMVGR